MTGTAQVRVEVQSRPESLALVRHVVAAFGRALGLDHELRGDIATAISEACNNVVLHAYDEQPGPMIVSLDAAPATIEAQVEDHGTGFTVSAARRSIGVGLPVISALADHAEFGQSESGGTRVRMEFIARRAAGVNCRPAAAQARRRPAAAPPSRSG